MIKEIKDYISSIKWFEIKYIIKNKLIYSWLSPIKNFIYWIIKSIQYAYFLRGDRDWDYSFILSLLKYKLSRTRKCIVKNQIIVRADEIGDEIKEVEDIISRLQNDAYCDDEYAKHHEYWGRTKIYTDDYNKIPGWKILKGFSTDKAKNEKREKEEQEARDLIRKKAEALAEQDWDMLFEIMRIKMRGWWD